MLSASLLSLRRPAVGEQCGWYVRDVVTGVEAQRHRGMGLENCRADDAVFGNKAGVFVALTFVLDSFLHHPLATTRFRLCVGVPHDWLLTFSTFYRSFMPGTRRRVEIFWWGSERLPRT